MKGTIQGIHHITAIAGDPQRNIEFYTGVLGLRLVKLTVNHDDPYTYHLYFGDEKGRPGTILTFFPWPGAHRGRRGTGQATAALFSIPERSMGFWTERLTSHGVPFDGPGPRFEEEVVAFSDPDGLALELVARAGGNAGATGVPGPVPPSFAIRGFHGVTLSVEGYERTAELLTGTLGFRRKGERGNRFRYEAGAGEGEGEGEGGSIVDVLCLPYATGGHVAVGTVHHVAFRTPGPREQSAWRNELSSSGYDVTPVIDRTYFRSIYFREPGGVLFEIATDSPGFSVDEPADRLGSRLVLPAWLEHERSRLEKVLPPVRIPKP